MHVLKARFSALSVSNDVKKLLVKKTVLIFLFRLVYAEYQKKLHVYVAVCLLAWFLYSKHGVKSATLFSFSRLKFSQCLTKQTEINMWTLLFSLIYFQSVTGRHRYSVQMYTQRLIPVCHTAIC